jgi:hypothetical protein
MIHNGLIEIFLRVYSVFNNFVLVFINLVDAIDSSLRESDLINSLGTLDLDVVRIRLHSIRLGIVHEGVTGPPCGIVVLVFIVESAFA